MPVSCSCKDTWLELIEMVKLLAVGGYAVAFQGTPQTPRGCATRHAFAPPHAGHGVWDVALLQ